LSLKRRIDRIEKQIMPNINVDQFVRNFSQQRDEKIRGFMMFGLSEHEAGILVDDFTQFFIDGCRNYGPGFARVKKYDFDTALNGNRAGA